MNETHDKINTFVKKGFLLDRESLDFLLKLDNAVLAEEILNKLNIITKSRVISKKTFNEHFNEIKSSLNFVEPEKKLIVMDFFNESQKINSLPAIKFEERDKNEKPNYTDLKILSSDVIPYRKIEVRDFVTHFKNRYNFFKDLLSGRKELDNLISINKIGNTRSFSIIGLVSNKRITKNKNVILEVEDLTGKVNVLINQDKEQIIKKAKEVVMDDVIGLKCAGSGDFIYASDIIFGDAMVIDKKKADEESYAIFISDIHFGSKLFLKEKFEKFLKWIRAEEIEDEVMREKVKKIKYLFIVGDNVDGIGVYPGQEALLTHKDVKDQYVQLAEYLKLIPKHIKIIMCPGQHDAVRVPEPQPAIDEEFALELTKMNNLFLVSNPSLIEIDCAKGKRGFKVLIYHGASMHSWIDEIEDLRMGQANLNPSKVVKYMLKHRHLSPMHSGNVYVPGENEDSLAIKEIPDILVTGDMHRTDVDIYNNILIICCSCWQSITPFEEKVGNQPDPCKVPMLNLKTREMKILDFS